MWWTFLLIYENSYTNVKPSIVKHTVKSLSLNLLKAILNVFHKLKATVVMLILAK